jgi:putative photosynthetic complex assembly protein
VSGFALRERPGAGRAGIGRAPAVAGGLVLALVAFGFALPHRHRALFPFPDPTAPVEASRQLRLLEGTDGTLRVEDAGTNTLLALLGEKQDGFVHGVAHGLQVTRRRSNIASDAPFSLTLYRDHRLVLADPSNGERIEIEGFGPTNEAVWLRFLPRRTGSP